jgi:outer membrane protein TolC
MMRILGCFLLFFTMEMQAQNASILTRDAFIGQVKQHHPVAFAAGLVNDKAQAQVLQARGAFDPALQGKLNQKTFLGTQYFNLLETGLLLPTRSPVEFSMGWEQNAGTYLNPEDKTPKAGLGNLGIGVDLGKGLLIDARRASLRQALLMQDAAPFQVQSILSDLLAQAEIDYWSWALAKEKLTLFEEASALAYQRLGLIRGSMQQGDRPTIDTVESFAQWQLRQINVEQARAEYLAATNFLEAYLWKDGLIPDQLTAETSPQPLQVPTNGSTQGIDQLSEWIAALDLHPLIQTMDAEIAMQDVEIKLKKESLRPELKLKYQLLSGNPAQMGTYFEDGYKWGGSAAFPIFLRSARGGVQISTIKKQELEAKRSQKKNEIRVKIETFAELQSIIDRQAQLAEEQMNRFKQLYDVEQIRLLQGDGSVFLINSRESKWVESREKVLELYFKVRKNQISLQNSRGLF